MMCDISKFVVISYVYFNEFLTSEMEWVLFIRVLNVFRSCTLKFYSDESFHYKCDATLVEAIVAYIHSTCI